ncbi:MAG TPA: hypothetical protein EYP35_02065 [Desulfobacterales bacterium]|nr:hypothetical protein [Desulfobacterales bacterium]HIP40252.1 hypothetical protein [Desulfocapsa sulfexigens]
MFLVISPLFLFYISRYISSNISIIWPRTFEISIASISLLIAIAYMSWGLLSLWIMGEGTPAPITPTRNLVTTGPYKLCRNPIELGTDLYFLSLGTFLDNLNTGILCLILGMSLGYAYIKLIEERELKLRFAQTYEKYLESTPLFLPKLFSSKERRQ